MENHERRQPKQLVLWRIPEPSTSRDKFWTVTATSIFSARYVVCSIERDTRRGRIPLSGMIQLQDHCPSRTTQKNENILPFPERYFSFRANQDWLIVACGDTVALWTLPVFASSCVFAQRHCSANWIYQNVSGTENYKAEASKFLSVSENERSNQRINDWQTDGLTGCEKVHEWMEKSKQNKLMTKRMNKWLNYLDETWE
jgi:hypothetical protein